MEERRKSPRVDLNLPAHWESATGIQEGRIINCSVGGCFVAGQVEEPGNEPLKLAIQLPDGKDLQLWGRVAYYLPTMGFCTSLLVKARLRAGSITFRPIRSFHLKIFGTGLPGNYPRSSERSLCCCEAVGR
jgi:hypothetical protein